jgi:glycosyltransferase involved in cell wall biosynthesis
MFVTLALPAYNEEENIEQVLTQCVASLKTLPHTWEILVIDNASSDATAERVQRFSQRQPEVRLVSHESNRLYAGSCATALREARGDRIAIMDSDGQHTAADLPRFMAKMDEGYSLVIGWRRDRDDPVARRVFSSAFNLMGKFYLRYPLHDLNCGFRMLDRSFAGQVSIKHHMNLSNPEFYAEAVKAGVRVGEVVVSHFPREKGTSTMTVGKIIRMFASVSSYLRALREEMKTAHVAPSPQLLPPSPASPPY